MHRVKACLQDIQLPESVCGNIWTLIHSEINLFNYWQILDELIIAGELQDSSKKSVLRVVSHFTLRYEQCHLMHPHR